MNPGTYHVPVLADASIAGIGAPQLPSGIYVDATFGGGGHSRLILDALDANGRLFSLIKTPIPKPTRCRMNSSR